MSARVLLVGGYSEPLKGAVIIEAVRRIAALMPDAPILVIRDHFEERKDDSLGPGITVEYLVGGCFCCSLKHDFLLLLRERHTRDGISLVIVEVPVTAEMDMLKGLIRAVMGEDVRLASVFVLDPATAEVMKETFPDLMSRNLGSSDMLAVGSAEDPGLLPAAVIGPGWEVFERIGQVPKGEFALLSRKGRCWPF